MIGTKSIAVASNQCFLYYMLLSYREKRNREIAVLCNFHLIKEEGIEYRYMMMTAFSNRMVHIQRSASGSRMSNAKLAMTMVRNLS